MDDLITSRSIARQRVRGLCPIEDPVGADRECPDCGQNIKTKLYRDPGWVWIECRNCGYGWTECWRRVDSRFNYQDATYSLEAVEQKFFIVLLLEEIFGKRRVRKWLSRK